LGINSTDAVKITRRYVGSDTSFTRGDWIFEKPFGGDTLNVSTYLNDTVIVGGGIVTQDFKGLCVGDVNGSNYPLPGAKAPFTSKIKLENNGSVKINSGESFDIPLISVGNYNVGAISMILNFPANLAKITGVKCSDNSNLVYHVRGNELRIGWFEDEKPMNLKNEETLIIISGRTTNDFKTGDIINFNLKKDKLCEFADETGEPLENVVLKTFSVEHSKVINSENSKSVLNNRLFLSPNPAENNVNIKYQISQDGFVTISLFNILGEKIADVVNKTVLKGIYDSDLKLTGINSGVYTFKMILGGKIVATERLVVAK